MKKQILLGLLLFTLQIPARADDLISILDNKESVVQEEEIQVLNKLFVNPTAEQVIFLSLLKKNDFERALFQWKAAVAGAEFAETANGKALWAYLLFQNGLTTLGVENLFAITNVSEIHPQLISLWKDALGLQHPVWKLAQINWSEPWTNIFGEAIEVQVKSRPQRETAPVAELESLLRKTPADSVERSWVQWNLVLALAFQGEVIKSAKLLRHLMNSANRVTGEDHLIMTAARLLYERGYLDAAVDYYDKIPKSSDFWLEAQEESAWSFLRKGETQNALARLKTILNPMFHPLVGPETLYLSSLAHLKICGYSEVVNNLKEFKKRFQTRAEILLKAQDEITPDIRQFVDIVHDKRLRGESGGKLLHQLPRYVWRDELLFQMIQTLNALNAESTRAGQLYARSLSKGTAQIGFQAPLENLKLEVEQRSHQAKTNAYLRIQELAKEEISEIQEVLQKTQIVEAEVIQQVHLSERVIKEISNEARTKTSLEKPKSDLLHFPFEGEMWADELAHYRVQVDGGCQPKGVQR